MDSEKEYWDKREGYVNIHEQRYSATVRLPLAVASNESLEPYGNIVTDYDREEVAFETWPSLGRRRIIPGTGRGAGISDERFRVFWEDGGYIKVEDIPAEEGSDDEIIAGRSRDSDVRKSVLIRSFTGHPDGGQVFYPERPVPFVMVFGKAKEDVSVEDMAAFYFDGSCGVQIKTSVWHNFPYPIGQEMTFRTKQSSVFACVMVDFVKEFGTFLEAPLHT